MAIMTKYFGATYLIGCINSNSLKGHFNKVIFLLTLCFFAVHLYGQSSKKNLIGTHVDFGTGGYGYFQSKGGSSYNVKYYYAIGLDYSRQLSERWDLCSGFEYTENRMTGKWGYTGFEEDDNWRFKAKLSMATIPLQVKYHVGKLVYFKGGLMFNVLSKLREEQRQTPKDRTSNVSLLSGFGFGIGFEHEFNSGMILSLSPYVKWNGIIERLKFIQTGVSFGVGYKF